MSCSPRVVGTERPDLHHLEAMLEHARFRGKAGEELALAIYDYFTSPLHGTYHFWPSATRSGCSTATAG